MALRANGIDYLIPMFPNSGFIPILYYGDNDKAGLVSKGEFQACIILIKLALLE